MLRLVQGPALRRAARLGPRPTRRTVATDKSPLAGDVGRKATHLHHKATTLLLFAFPAYLAVPLLPSELEDGVVDKALGCAVSFSVAAHSWIGMNYVATDYVPKVSKALVGPARVFNAALAGVTLLGLGRCAVNGRGGVRGAVKGLWRPTAGKE